MASLSVCLSVCQSFMAGHSSGEASLKGVLEQRVIAYAQGDVLADIKEAVSNDSVLKVCCDLWN